MSNLYLIRYSTIKTNNNKKIIKLMIIFMSLFLILQSNLSILFALQKYHLQEDIYILLAKKNNLQTQSNQFQQFFMARQNLAKELLSIRNNHVESQKTIAALLEIIKVKNIAGCPDILFSEKKLKLLCISADKDSEVKIKKIIDQTNLFKEIQIEKKWQNEQSNYELNFQAE